jgi:hypothetical protein
MVTVDDVFHHIAQELRCYSGMDPIAAIEEFMTGCTFDLRISVTTDVEVTEMNYLDRYGHGNTFYFRLRDYQHAKKLAGEIFYQLQGSRPDLTEYNGSRFEPEDRLYLFIHVSNVLPSLKKGIV